MPYHLPQHVFFCRAGSHCVFLDVERDRYVAVHKTRVDILRPWLSTRSDASAPVTLQEMPRATESIAHDLAAQGLLTVDELNSKSFESVITPLPRAIELPRQLLLRNLIRFGRFYSACSAADQKLTEAGVSGAIEFVRRRKTQRPIVSPAHSRLLSLVSTFLALRLFYPRPYLCLFDSLALVEFLAMYAIFPTWVFAVHGEPFNAHCWVQYGDLVLNDSLHRVARLAPIMTV